MGDLFRKHIPAFIRRFGLVRLVISVLLIAFALYSFISAWSSVSGALYTFLLWHYRASLTVMIIVLVGGYIGWMKREQLHSQYLSLRERLIPQIKKTTTHMTAVIRAWLTRFMHETPKGKWLMVRMPVIILAVLWVLVSYGPLFLPPRIMTSFPGNKTTGAPLSSTIEVIFNRSVIKSTIEKNLHITPALDATLSWEGNQKLIITPKKQLARGQQYTVAFSGLVLSSYFIPQITTSAVSFETIGNPTVIVASPEDEAPEDGTPITVVFDRPMIPLTTATNSALKKGAFTIEPAVKGEGRWLGTTAYQLRPSEPFKKASTYTVTVPKGLSSLDGGSLQEAYTFSFSSIRPRVIDRSPHRDEAYASPTASVSAQFNQPIDPSSAKELFAVYDSRSNRVPGTVRVIGSTVGFYATGGLKREERYSVKVAAGLKGMEGPNGMETDDTWNFTVSPKPSVIGTTPRNTQTDVGELYSIDVSFRSPMKETSFDDAISISPKPDLKPSYYVSNYGNTNQLHISTYLGRSTHYTITIGGNATDQYGVALGNGYTFSFDTAAYKPSISINPQGTYFGSFNQHMTPRIVAQVVNANSVEYSLYRLKKEDMLELYNRRYGRSCSDETCRNWQNYDTSKLERVRTWKETYDAAFNTPVHVVTKVTTDSGATIPSGMYFLDMKIPQGIHDNMVMIVSDATLTVKRSEKQLFVWSVDQTSGDVVPDMTIQATDEHGVALTNGTTNADGVFMKDVNLKDQDTILVWGTKGNDTVVASTAWAEGLNAYDFGLPTYYNPSESKDYKTDQTYKLYVTVDRPIYRPGQKVYIKGVIRKDTDGAYEQIKPGESVQATITDSNNKSIFVNGLATTSFGSFASEFQLSKQAELGEYRVEVSYNGNKYAQGFQVEEYKKPELAVSVVPNKPSYVQGDSATVGVTASYYFGAPVSGAPVDWTLKTEDYAFRWDKDWRFEFGDPESYWSRAWWYYSGDGYFSGEKVTDGTGKTNAKGEFTIAPPIDIGKYKTSQRMMVEAVVNDISNQSVAGSQEFIVNKSSVMAGIRPESYGNQTDKEATVEIVSVDPKGVEVPSTPVNVEFFKRTWNEIREQNPDDGQFYYVSKPQDSLVSTATVTTNELARATASFTPKEGGTYKVRATAKDAKGNTSVSGSFLWVSGFGFQAARENNDRIVVVTDKRDYLVGDTMSVFVASPFASASAKTLLTAERGSVLSYKLVETSETSNNFDMPIPPTYTPNVFVSAVVIKGSDQVKNPPEFKIGYSEVKVTDKKQQIQVSIKTDKKKYKPKDTLKATIQTNDLLGHPIATELAVGLVDKAVWDLSGIELPEIYKTFYQPRNLAVATSQLMTISIDRINANTNLGSKGGSGGGCFTGDTPVLMSGGVQKAIENVRVGDTILTRENEQSSKLVEAKVLRTYVHTVPTYLIVNGSLRVTGEHRVFVNGEWKIAGLLEIGDVLVDVHNNPVPVRSIERMSGTYTVYNLEVETYRTYFAGGIYVHNQKGGFDTTRTDFPDTAYWNPEIKTNEQGTATVSIQLPDSLTTWRMGAMATSKESAFGSAVSEVVVGRDVLIRPFIPRFVAVGDEPMLGGIITNTSGSDQVFAVTIEGNGLSILEGVTKQVRVADGEQAKVMWKTRALSTKTATVTLRVADGQGVVKDAVAMPMPVVSYFTPETVATAGEVKGGNAKEAIALPTDIDPAMGSARIMMSPSLGASGLGGLSYLLSYPYDCVEQITSKFISAVSVYRVLLQSKQDAVGPFTKKALQQVVSDGVQRLVSQQHPDGGWGWWIDQPSDPFFSAYALYALAIAHSYTTIPQQTIDNGARYLQDVIKRGGSDVSPETQAFMIRTLSELGRDMSSLSSVLFDRRFELSIEARAHLALALYKNGNTTQSRRIRNELISLAKKTATTTHWEDAGRSYRYFGSSASTTARVLALLTETDSKNPLIAEATRYLLTTRTDGHWVTTYDTASAIDAIAGDMLKKGDQSVNLSYEVRVNGSAVKKDTLTAKDLLSSAVIELPMNQFTLGGSTPVQFAKSGTGNLYYNIDLRYFLPFTSVAPLERGMTVIREFTDVNGKGIAASSIAQNTEAWERLIIVVPEERHYVAIEDPLPAGLESVNESLKNVRMLGAKTPALSDPDNRQLYFTRKEYHDDKTVLFARYLPAGVYEVAYRVRATVPGIYHRPPAQAYQIYVPDVSGHSDGGWFEVK